MRILRRKREVQAPVVLPSLDRLAGLIERVVELVDEVSGGRVGGAEVPESAERPLVQANAPTPAAVDGWLAYVSSPHGYTLLAQPGSPPARGDSLELDGVRHHVVRFAASPLPGDARRCAVVERQEPPEPERTIDA
jgi:hypothetical protein